MSEYDGMLEASQASTYELIQRAVLGDQIAFARIVDREAIRIRLMIGYEASRRALAADFDEDDCFQIVVSAAWVDLPNFENRGPGSFTAWVRRIVRNAVVDRVRYLDAGCRAGVATPLGTGREPLDPQTSVATFVARRHDYAVVRSAMDSLAKDDRELVELHFLEELTFRELAERLGMPRATVFDRLERALRSVRAAVDTSTERAS